MKECKKVSELMINMFDYPHVPYWFTVSQAIEIMKISYPISGPRPDPVAILVFDEKYNLIGTLTRRELLSGLEPRCTEKQPQDKVSECEIPREDLFNFEISKAGERPVSEIMSPVRYFIEPGASAARAAFIMVRHGLILLPVVEEKRNVVGLVRMSELFDYISGDTA